MKPSKETKKPLSRKKVQALKDFLNKPLTKEKIGAEFKRLTKIKVGESIPKNDFQLVLSSVQSLNKMYGDIATWKTPLYIHCNKVKVNKEFFKTTLEYADLKGSSLKYRFRF